MKEKTKRNYNVFFNIHTVSGIVISVVLYIVFFAGAFTIFEEPINDWEFEKETTTEKHFKTDYDRILTKLIEDGYHVSSNTVRINEVHDTKPYIRVLVLGEKVHDTIKKGWASLKFNPITYEYINAENDTVTSKGIWYFIYRLHFLGQIPRIGLYLSGLVSLFFLFAIVTGIVVHWKKIVSNFFNFRPWAGFKAIWTDAHTVLGVIGIPFQFVYAITGAFYGLSVLLMIPSVFLLFDGNQQELLNTISPENGTFKSVEKPEKMISINPLVYKTKSEIGTYEYLRAFIKNYGDKSANLQITATVNDSKRDFVGTASYSYKLSDGSLLSKDTIENNEYNSSLTMVFARLHFVTFGGNIVKIIYFLLALITCFVIITGVLIWLKARDKKTNSKKQKRFVRRVGAWYMGICLGIFPAIALLFVLAKTVPSIPNKDRLISTVFFSFWAIFIIYSLVVKNTFKINKMALITAGVFGIAIPIVNGITTQNWLWLSFKNGYYNMMVVDIFWFFTGALSLIIAIKLKQKSPKLIT